MVDRDLAHQQNSSSVRDTRNMLRLSPMVKRREFHLQQGLDDNISKRSSISSTNGAMIVDVEDESGNKEQFYFEVEDNDCMEISSVDSNNKSELQDKSLIQKLHHR